MLLVSSMLAIIIVSSLAVVVISSLMVIVVSPLTIVVISILAVVVSALLTGLTLTGLVAVLAWLVSPLTVVVSAMLTWLIWTGLVWAGLVSRTLLLLAVFACYVFGILEIGTLWPRLIGARLVWPWLVASLAWLIAAVIVVVPLLITVVVAVLRSWLVWAFGAIFAVLAAFGVLVAGTLFRGLAFRYAKGLSDSWAFRFLFVRIRFHNCLCLLSYLSAIKIRMKVLSYFVLLYFNNLN